MFRRVLYGLLMLVLVCNVGLPQYVHAATDTLTVDGEGVYNDGSYAGAGSVGDWHDVTSDDDDISYWTGIGAAIYKSWSTDNTAIPAGSTINSVTLYTKAMMNAAGSSTYTVYTYQGGRYGETTHVVDNTYTLDSKTWTTNPKTGIAWVTSDIDNMLVGVKYANTLYYLRVTYVYVVVNYTPPTFPTVTTNSADDLTPTSATLNGNIDDDGGATITDYGFVWGTSSNTTNPIATEIPADTSYASNWTIGAGTYSEGAIDHATGATLTADTTYYFRAAAYNSEGWDYGDEVSFETVGIPSITTQAATSVASTTAKLNAIVSDDNGQAGTVGFAWAETSDGPFANWAAMIAAPSGHTDNATGTWATGTYPYLEITSLTISTGYTFMTQISNDAGVSYGSQLTFTTSSGIDPPSNFIAIPTATTISLSWVKGDGASLTAVRHSTGAYPGLSEGTLDYFGTGNSVMVEDLTEGTTYYFRAWGYTGGTYSTGNTTVLCTTLAYGEEEGGIDLGEPPTNSSWVQTPSATNLQNIPLIGGLVTSAATEYGQDENFLWYMIWVMLAGVVGIVAYNIGERYHWPVALFAEVFWCGIGATLGLVMLWIVVALCLIGGGFTLFAKQAS